MSGMNDKTIKGILSRKFDEFVESIEDEQVRESVSKNSIITGGSIASMLLGEKVNDYDIYFTNKETVLLVCKYYLKWFQEKLPGFWINGTEVQDKDGRIKIHIPSSGVLSVFGDLINPDEEQEEEENDERKKYVPVFITSNAITLSGKVQLVIRFYGNAEEIHKNYDFAHCTNYWTSKDSELRLNNQALRSLLSKNLVYQGSLYPICSLFRIRKFIQRGWKCNAGQILKACLQVSELNLTDISVLEEQLIGVDTTYFSQIINILREQKEKNKDITSSYIYELVNRMF